MKLKKMWITLIAIFSLGMIGSIATIKLANPVQAKINVSVFPKKCVAHGINMINKLI
ncbi:hypothetical protein [Lactobacillus laiwuensis]|uniref:hypothetical protein n=1 Tax=Lactobacillus laiwuensis TaxID=2841034 RepID=UPI001CC6B316|nr:hypothetical protein [Lactobacillus laiwuensis]